jgi:hypothetical protein
MKISNVFLIIINSYFFNKILYYGTVECMPPRRDPRADNEEEKFQNNSAFRSDTSVNLRNEDYINTMQNLANNPHVLDPQLDALGEEDFQFNLDFNNNVAIQKQVIDFAVEEEKEEAIPHNQSNRDINDNDDMNELRNLVLEIQKAQEDQVEVLADVVNDNNAQRDRVIQVAENLNLNIQRNINGTRSWFTSLYDVWLNLYNFLITYPLWGLGIFTTLSFIGYFAYPYVRDFFNSTTVINTNAGINYNSSTNKNIDVNNNNSNNNNIIGSNNSNFSSNNNVFWLSRLRNLYDSFNRSNYIWFGFGGGFLSFIGYFFRRRK